MAMRLRSQDHGHLRIVVAMREPFELEQRQIVVSVSAGNSLCPEDATEIADLIRCAKAAMARSRRAARSRRQALSRSSALMRVPPRSGYVTVEAAADQLKLSRPHVLKLIAENRFRGILHQVGGTPLICEQEVRRLSSELLAM